MGWKGMLRSLMAADRRARAQINREARARDRAIESVDRVADDLEAEVARDRLKILQYQTKVIERPLSSGGLEFDADTKSWRFKPFSDDTGKLKWRLEIRLGSSDVEFDGNLVLTGQTLQPLAMAISELGVFVAFRMEKTKGKTQKLIYKSDPSRNRVFLTVEGKNLRATEGNPDDPDIDGISVVAFPKLESETSVGAIRVQTDEGVASAEFKLPATWAALTRQGQTLLGQFDQQMSELLAPLRERLQGARRTASGQSGCATVFMFVVMVGVLVLVATKIYEAMR